MRAWDCRILHKLPSVKDYPGCSNQLGGQWNEIRMMLGYIRKRGKLNHSTVNYINNYSIHHLYAYGLLVWDEMIRRGFNPSDKFHCEYCTEEALQIYYDYKDNGKPIFEEHNSNWYLKECLDNLKDKGIILNIN